MKYKQLHYIYKFILVFLLFPQFNITAQDIIKFSYDEIFQQQKIWLPIYWKYKAGDDSLWARKDLNDDDWIEADAKISSENELPHNIKETAWFRCHFKIDSTLFNKSIGFVIWHAGNIDVFLNGSLIYKNSRLENADKKILPFPIVFNSEEDQVLAVRYNYNKIDLIREYSDDAGFAVAVGEFKYLLDSQLENIQKPELKKTILITIAIVLAVVHLFLFFFQRQKKQNLYYVLFLIFFSAFIYISNFSYYSYSLEEILLFRRIIILVLLFTIYSGSITIYSIYKEPSVDFVILSLVSLVIGICGYFFIHVAVWLSAYAFIIVLSVYGSWKLFSKRKELKFSEKVIRYGFMIMGAAGFLQMLMSFGVLTSIIGISDPYIYGVFIFLISMSVAFSYDFASTSRDLQKRLVEVKALSEKTIEHERIARERELQRKLLEADNTRKTKELEEARNLQLSMLPACQNDLPGIDICFDMKTATEVGGDYYDYYYSNDGTLNIAIGDATGHGTKAGLMVATIKSLFNALGAKMMIPDFFNRCTEIIKTMNLGNLFMSMTIIRYKNNRLIVSAAGMPPILIYKKSENRIDEILIKGMPLGGFRDFKYYEEEYELESGDIILMMTDGLPELFNEDKIMFGDEKIKELLLMHNQKTATEINRELFKAGDIWRGKRPQDDDMTFVIIKIK